MYEEKTLSTSETIREPASSIHFVFNSEGKDLTVISYSDLLDGYVYDLIAEKSVKYERREFDPLGHTFFEINPGDYFVAVVISDTEDGRYSHTAFTLKEGEYLTLEKTFDPCCPRFSFEEW